MEKLQFHNATEKVLDEIRRFHEHKRIDFKAILTEFVKSQVDYHASVRPSQNFSFVVLMILQVEQAWNDLLPAIDSISSKSSCVIESYAIPRIFISGSKDSYSDDG